jgi:CMP-N-acetylneuraminic acid synthetase
MSCLGIIVARKHSRRVKRKNIRPLGGQPLITWTFNCAKKAESLDKIVVSTDDEAVRDLAFDYDVEVPYFPRRKDLCEDVDSVPAYSPIIIQKESGEQLTSEIDIITIEDLWRLINSPIYKTPRGEEVKYPKENIKVLKGQSSNHKGYWTKLKAIVRHFYDGTIIRVNTISGLVDVTPNHSLISAHGEVINATRINVGDKLASPQFPKAHINHGFFVGSRELAWLYGFFCAEGCVYRYRKNSQWFVQFTNKNLDLLEKSKQIFEENFHYKLSMDRKRAKQDGTYNFINRNKQAFKFFKENFYTNSGEKKVPKTILNAPTEIKLAFLDGYNAGDGLTKRQKKWHNGRYKRFGSKSQILCQGLLWLISQTVKQTWSIHTRDDKPNFTQIILNSGEKSRWKDHREIKKIRTFHYKGFVYDIVTEEESFTTGVGNVRVHNTALVLIDMVKFLQEKAGYKPEWVVLLQPTSPFRLPQDIDNTVKLVQQSTFRSGLTVVKVSQFPEWMFTGEHENGHLRLNTLHSNLKGEMLVSQNLPTYFYPNGAVYVTSTHYLLKRKRIFGQTCLGYEMPIERSIDLEEPKDFEYAEFLLKKYGRQWGLI